MRKDDMANALAWASRRASLDSAVLDGQPADRAMVAGVLREDPTLPDDLRISYAHHLLRLTLALDDPSNTDIVPMMAATNRELAEKVFEQLRTAIEGEHPMAVYHLVESWITHPPAGADLSRWRPLLGMALLAQTNALVKGEPEPLIKFLEQFLNVPPTLELDTTLQQVIEISRKRGEDNPEIARIVFLLSAT